MSPDRHIGRSLTGAFALARFDRTGMEYFDFSYDGFWRSFNAILVSLPAVFAAALLTPTVVERLAKANPQLSQGAAAYPDNAVLFLVFETLGFLAGWAFFPVAMIWIARRLDMGKRYVPLIVAWNWSRAVISWAVRLPMILFGLAVIPAGLFSLLWLVVLLYILAYRWFVIRAATEASGPAAFGLVVLDILGTMVVQGLVAQIYWLISPGTPVAPGNT